MQSYQRSICIHLNKKNNSSIESNCLNIDHDSFSMILIFTILYSVSSSTYLSISFPGIYKTIYTIFARRRNILQRCFSSFFARYYSKISRKEDSLLYFLIFFLHSTKLFPFEFSFLLHRNNIIIGSYIYIYISI